MCGNFNGVRYTHQSENNDSGENNKQENCEYLLKFGYLIDTNGNSLRIFGNENIIIETLNSENIEKTFETVAPKHW